MKCSTLVLLIYASLILVSVIGYIVNIVKLVTNFDLLSTGEVLLRGAGIMLPPLGSIMGLFV